MQIGTILFIKNILNCITYIIGSKLFSNIMQSKYSIELVFKKSNGSHFDNIKSGEANFPDLCYQSIEVPERIMSEGFNELFSSSDERVQYLCYQDYAITAWPYNDLLSKMKIELQFDESKISPVILTEL